jgi:hypothetical protein
MLLEVESKEDLNEQREQANAAPKSGITNSGYDKNM